MLVRLKEFAQIVSGIALLEGDKLFFKMEITSTRTLRSKTSAKINCENPVRKDMPIKQEIKTETLENTSSKRGPKKSKGKSVVATDSVTIKSEYFDEQAESEYKLVPSVSDKSSVSPRKRPAKSNKDTLIKREKISKVKTESSKNIPDIEDGVWKPENWREVLDNILKMRKLYVAPVDSLGCEECPEKGIPPEVFRYQTLISVMLSSQTRDEVTFAATQRLIEHGLKVDNILDTPDEKIGELIYPAGFWKSKIKYIKNTTQILKDQYKGDIPRTFKELCKLPGVGPKMANIVMSVAWNDTVGIAVDTHVHRISNRLGWVPKPTKEPEQTRKALESWLPKDQWKEINLTLVGFGQTVCRPIGPNCDLCLNKSICPYGRTELSSKCKKKPKT